MNRADNFNRTGSVALGGATPSDGGSTWVDSAGNSATGTDGGTGEVVCFQNADPCLAWLECSVTDHEADGEIIKAESTQAGLVTRVDDANNYYYWFVSSAGAGSLYKNVSGSFTLLGTGSGTFTFAVGNHIQLRSVSTTITGYLNSVSDFSTTDSALSTGTKAGIRGTVSSFTPYYNSFAITDLAAGGTTENATPIVVTSSVVNPTISLSQTFTPVTTTASVVSPEQTVSSSPGVIQATGAIDAGATALSATIDPIVATGTVVTPTTGGDITESPSPIVATWTVVTPDTTLSNTPTSIIFTSTVVIPTTTLATTFTPVVVTGSVVTPTDSRLVSPSPVVGTATLVTFATTLLYSPTPIVATTNVVTPNTTVGNISPPGGFNVIAHVYTPGAVAAYVHVPNSQGWIHTAGGQGGIVP